MAKVWHSRQGNVGAVPARLDEGLRQHLTTFSGLLVLA